MGRRHHLPAHLTGFCYLAFILDCYSRMIVGWQLATHLRAQLVLDALEMANGLGKPGAGLIAHSDRGSQGGFNWSLQHLDREALRWAGREGGIRSRRGG